jgi:hypothetical protein
VNTVSFPVLSGHKYQFTTYVTSPMPPPPDGTPLGLDVNWTP